MIRAAVAVAMLATAATPFVAVLANPPATVPLVERVAAVRADLLARPCAGDDECWRRIAAHGVDPNYYEGPDEWLESACLAKRDATACAYLGAWRQVEAEHSAFIGRDCAGFSRPLYGDAPEELPLCTLIEERQP